MSAFRAFPHPLAWPSGGPSSGAEATLRTAIIRHPDGEFSVPAAAALAAAVSAATTDRNRAFLQAVLSHQSDAVVACDARGVLTVFNAAAERLHNQRAEPLLPEAWADHYRLLTAEGAPMAPEQVPLLRALRGETVDGCVMHIAPVGLPRRTVVCNGEQLNDSSGEVIGAVVTMRDITQSLAADERAARRARALLSTVETQRAVHAARDRETVLRTVAERVVNAFPTASGAVVELVEGPVLRYAATAGDLSNQIGSAVTIAGSLSGAALTHGEVERCDDTETDPRVDREACRRTGIRSMCIAPLLAGDTPVGALKVSSTQPNAFDQVDCDHLELLAESLRAGLRFSDDYVRAQQLLDERTAALAALELSEERFGLAFDNSPLGVVVTSLASEDRGRIIQVNHTMARISGFSRERLLEMSVSELDAESEWAAGHHRMIGLMSAESGSSTFEQRYRHADGHDVWVRVQSAAVRAADGTPRYVVAKVEDVTAARAAQAQIQQQARLLELIPAAVIVRDLDGAIRWWNAASAMTYGWPLEVALGRNSHRLLDTRFGEGGDLGSQTAALEQHGWWNGELRHLTATGQELTVLSRQVLHRDPDGGPDVVLEINTDVTSARISEGALAESEQRFRAQFTHSAAGQMIRSLDGTLLDVNPSLARMLGYPREQLVGSNWERLLHPDTVLESRHRQAGIIAGEAEAYDHEKRLRRADGTHVEVRSTVSLVRDADGRPRHLIGVVSDISATKAAERAAETATAELAQRNDELEAANQLKLDLIGMLGHEIGGPLASIVGYTEMALDADPAVSGSMSVRQTLEVIDRNARRLNGVVREVLTMVSADAGKLVATPRVTLVGPRLHAAVDVVGSPHPPQIRCTDGLTASVQPGHLDQILVNLISNAQKYAGGATAIVVTAADGTVRIRVQDNGPGVPAEFRDRLFERFTRDSATAATITGTGLGLHIVRELARANSGSVYFEPRRGGGSTFVVELPQG